MADKNQTRSTFLPVSI